MILLVVCASLFVLTEQTYDQTASCLMKLHNDVDGIDIGRVWFSSTPGEKQRVRLAFLHPKIANGKHGFHVHALPVAEGGNDCLTTGGHFNPDGVDHGAAGGPAASHHVGDFGNVLARDGFVLEKIDYTVGPGIDQAGYNYVEEDRFALDGENSIRGRAVVLHAGTDDLGLGGDEGSRKTGNAGSRLACCTLE